jgi:hypothetical protein
LQPAYGRSLVTDNILSSQLPFNDALGITMTGNISQRILTMFSSYEGRIAIYKEKMRVWRVRVVEIRTDDTHVFAKIETVETSGLNSAGGSWDIAAPASELTTADYWSAPYVGWQIFFNPIVVQKVVEIVSVLPPGKTYLDDYTKRPAPNDSKFVSINTPGPCAKDLYSYLWGQQFAEL